MDNIRVIYVDSFNRANEEIRKIGVDADCIGWLAAKSIHINIKLENVTPFAANIIKQEMLGKGGDAAVHIGAANCSVSACDVLIMGTYNQYQRLLAKLKLQPGSLKEIANEIANILSIIKNGKGEFFRAEKYHLPLGEKTYVMGILNVTPDSFSDGGKYLHPDVAVKRAKEMVAHGANIIDVGGESTRPGHTSVDPLEEISRVCPVIERLAKELDVPISVDTSKAVVARKALEAGASIVNDVWGFQMDSEIAKVVSDFQAGAILMHNSQDTQYQDVMGDILKFLKTSVKIALDAGNREECLMIDPGIGFSKTTEQNLEIMRKLKELSSMGMPICLGTSRKSMIGNVLELPVNERLEGSAASVVLGIANGVDLVRVHDVKEISRVVKMTDAMVRNTW